MNDQKHLHFCHITKVVDDYTEQYINSGVGINKSYIFHNFKFRVCLQS